MSFEDFGLRPELLKAIEYNGYETPTPIQTGVIPTAMEGRDILARAQTGTGKTDAFALPIVDQISRNKVAWRDPRALILAPTRELALQVGDCVKEYARRVSLRCTVVCGGMKMGPQVDRIRRGVDILVATPGRLIDLAQHRVLSLDQLEYLVFDEADRMLDLGFRDEINQILDLVPKERRTLLFSATYTQEIRELAKVMLREPEFIEVDPDQKAADAVVQKVHLVDRSKKRALLIHLIRNQGWKQALVFVRTRLGANKLVEKLAEKRISTAALHSNKSQSFRTRTLKEFKDGDIRILVATDVAARGLDITNLPHVVNYDIPGSPADYIHRIGRTGRAGVEGVARTLVSKDERKRLKEIEAHLGREIPREEVGDFTEGGDVPSFVLYRPDDAGSERRADRDIKELVKERKAGKAGKAGKKAGGAGRSRGGQAQAVKGKPKGRGKKESRSRKKFQEKSRRQAAASKGAGGSAGGRKGGGRRKRSGKKR